MIGKARRIRSHSNDADSGSSVGETRFTYDGSRNQVYRHSNEQGKINTIIQQGGTELIIEDGERRFRRNLGNAIVERSGNSITTRYVYTDHLGSVDVITDAAGAMLEKLSFDAFGKRRAVFNQSGQSIALNLSTLLAITHQGFTGHQQVDHAGIVQMGGRIYDSHIGRFLQADPFVQSPSNSQNFNRYSYVLNNPLSYTDPSGYFHNPLKKVGRGMIRGAVKVFGADVVNFVGSAVSMFYGGAWGAAAWSYEFNRAMGASSSAAFKSAAIAGASAFAFSQIGSYYQLNASGSINFGGNMMTAGQVAGQITAHAMVGGVAASLQGGKFGHGFFSAGVTKGLGGRFLPGGPELSGSEVVYGTVVSAMIGGTASVVAGGKFANGARTASMQYLMNQARTRAGRMIERHRSKSSGDLDLQPIMADNLAQCLETTACANTAAGALTVLTGGGSTVALLAGRAALAGRLSSLSLGAAGTELYLNRNEALGADFAGFGNQSAVYFLDRYAVPIAPAPVKPFLSLGLDSYGHISSYLYREASKNG